MELLPEIVEHLRVMASTGATVPQLLREIISRIPNTHSPTFSLVLYMREAFHLSLRAVTPLGGWDEGGKGEITDDRIEEFLRPEMETTRHLWERKKRV
jgi:hypothetical protein